ncbi:vitamin K epoxide reductase complex subunit 1-like protein 1 [Toxorhynchites rutilus septentrionalis]|uniref:vitamin K epoxide reductase complex subunit 1-like protein 1 n=1 Tax=Toxorhynchites rutilus septentrionalis TaxID=329112 RepID=UPI0024784AE0|nr:vitamin K epoxide reductase complex subunit 1-like protein 1 [Toxorhynchites rutilus septentrionalis]
MSYANCKSSCTAGLVGLSLAGFLLSLYTSYVEIRVERDHSYQAMCDISERVSCTKVFSSAYGRGFGIVGDLLGDDSPLNVPNGFYGIFYYFLVAGLAFSNSILVTKLASYLIALSNLLSIYLAYLLYFVLEDLCLVCVATYGVNLISLIVALQKVQILDQEEQVMRVMKKDQ